MTPQIGAFTGSAAFGRGSSLDSSHTGNSYPFHALALTFLNWLTYRLTGMNHGYLVDKVGFQGGLA